MAGCTSGIGSAALDARTTGRTPGESTRGGVHCVVPALLRDGLVVARRVGRTRAGGARAERRDRHSERHTGLEPLLALAVPLAAHREQDLLIAALVDDPAQLSAGTARLNAARAEAAQRGVRARIAAFTSSDHTADALRLATDEDVALMLMDASDEQLAGPASFEGLFGGRPLRRRAGDRRHACAGSAILVPFGGHDHDWAALELGAWFAQATASPLRLVGAGSDPDTGRRDASRLLGSASLALQRALGVTAEPLLATPGAEGMLAATAGAGLVIAGLSDRWSRDGVGAARLELALRARCPVLLVRGGVRPGGLAPPRALTRYTWSAHP